MEITAVPPVAVGLMRKVKLARTPAPCLAVVPEPRMMEAVPEPVDPAVRTVVKKSAGEMETASSWSEGKESLRSTAETL